MITLRIILDTRIVLQYSSPREGVDFFHFSGVTHTEVVQGRLARAYASREGDMSWGIMAYCTSIGPIGSNDYIIFSFSYNFFFFWFVAKSIRLDAKGLKDLLIGRGSL